MERLTKRTKYGAVVPYIKLSYESEYNDWITDITDKLAEYEDLEEQGLLLRLPESDWNDLIKNPKRN